MNDDEDFKEAISKAGILELMELIINRPDLITDRYYRDIGQVITARARKLLNGHTMPMWTTGWYNAPIKE